MKKWFVIQTWLSEKENPYWESEILFSTDEEILKKLKHLDSLLRADELKLWELKNNGEMKKRDDLLIELPLL